MTAAKRTPKKRRPPTKKSRKNGRPTLYSDKLVAKICRRLAEGETLRAVCRDPVMPDKATILRWLGDEAKAAFRDQYAHARDMQADALFDEALEIADDASGDWTEDKDGKKSLDHEHVQRSRLRVDTRKWAAGKLAPKRYGDKLQHTGEGGGPIRTELDLTGIPTDVLRELRKLAARI